MRRRTKRGPNDSESTGKIGQELPANQPAPLKPSYPEAAQPDASVEQAPAHGDETSHRFGVTASLTHEGVAHSQANAVKADAAHDAQQTAPVAAVETPPAKGKLVVEHQPDSLGTPPAEVEAVPQKSPRGYVVLTIGLPGSGKTTWFKRRGVTPLSSDMLRSILFDDITEQRYQGLVFSTLRSLLRARLIAKMPWNYVDATNLSPHERRQWIKMAKSFGYDVQAVYFDVPLEVCLERNRKRERTVAEDVMHKMAERLKAPDFKEGFSKITLVRVKSAAPESSTAPVEAAF